MKRGEGIHLTDFDREVLSVLLAHGGWNAPARSRLASLAKRYGVSSAGLSRVLAGLAQAARDGRLQAYFAARGGAGAIRGDGAARGVRAGAAPGGAVSGPGAVAQSLRGDAAGAELGGRLGAASGTTSAHGAFTRSDRVLLSVVGGLLLVSLLLATQLGWMIWSGLAASGGAARSAESDQEREGVPVEGFASGDASAAPSPAAGVATPSAAGAGGRTPVAGAESAAAGGSAKAPTRASAESAPSGARPARPPAVPASYPRTPGFTATLESPAFMQALAEARAAASRLEALASDPRSILAARQNWRDVHRAIGISWPRLDDTLRRGLVDRVLAVIRVAEEAALAEALVEPFGAWVQAAPDDPAAIRLGAWSAGVVGAILSEPGLPPEVVQAVASMRLVPAEGSGSAFDRFAAGWLDRALVPIIDRIGKDHAQEDFDRVEAWVEAQRRLHATGTAQEAWLRAIDAMLRRPLRIDLPGTSADVIGRFASLVDWRPSAATTAALRRRLESWQLDPSVEAPRLWALGSIVRQGRMAPWFTDEMLVGERSSMELRRQSLTAMLAALPAGDEPITALARAPRELLDRRRALIERAAIMQVGENGSEASRAFATELARAGDASQQAFAHALELERLTAVGVVGAMLMEGAASEAAQRLALLEAAAARPPLERLTAGGRGARGGAEPTGDGTLARRLDQARGNEDRIDAIRRRRLESSTDLGPIDAARLVREALLGDHSSVRLTAQGVIVDSFASGARVAQELVDQFGTIGAMDGSLARFIERLTGERLPPHINPRFRAGALAALLRHRLSLAEHPWHGVDALLSRTAALTAERLEREGGGAEALREAREPSGALEALASLERSRAGTRAVLRAVPAPLEELDARDAARMALASGPSQRLVALLWRVLELEAFVAAADRPAAAATIESIVERAVVGTSRASSSLEQAVIIERARTMVQGLQLDPAAGGLP